MRLPPLLLVTGLSSCATLATTGSGDQNLPSSGMGPFRPLVSGETPPGAVAPFVMVDSTARYREPSVVAATDDRTSAAVWVYAVAHAGKNDVIVRTRADDARSFFGDISDGSVPHHAPRTVLVADQPWEGSDLSGPDALRVGGTVYLYYTASGGIGLATSDDGLTFTKRSGDVFSGDATVDWEFTLPRAPSVTVLPDGSWRMFYAAGNAIGEARSADGILWTRLDADPSTPRVDPVLEPSTPVDPASLASGIKPPFDEGRVDDPVVALRTTIAGRLQVRVLYTGLDRPFGAAGASSAIGFAARYGDSGRLSRQPAPVYDVALHESAPAFFEWSGGSMLYVAEDNTTLDPTKPFPAIVAAFAPVNGTLPPPAPFPTSP